MKQNSIFSGKRIISLDEIKNMNYDGILISAYTQAKIMYDKLMKKNIDKNKIITFF